MNKTPQPPHEGEEDASKIYEKLRAIRNNSKSKTENDLNQPFLPDPSEETGAESIGGGYETAPPKPQMPDYIAEQLPDESHKAAARKGIPAARNALEGARNRNKPTPPQKPSSP